MPSVSKKQQRAMGMAYAAKDGKIDPSKLKGSPKELYDSMSKKDLKDFAETKHKGLPEKVKESMLKTDPVMYGFYDELEKQGFLPLSSIGRGVSVGVRRIAQGLGKGGWKGLKSAVGKQWKHKAFRQGVYGAGAVGGGIALSRRGRRKEPKAAYYY